MNRLSVLHRQKKLMPRLLLLARPSRPLSRMSPHRPLRPSNTRSGPTRKDQTADVAALTTVADAVGAIAGGVARVAGATVGQTAICRHQNMLRRGPWIRARANHNRMSRPRPTISRLFSPANRWPNIRTEFQRLLLRPRPRLNLLQTRQPSRGSDRFHRPPTSCWVP